MIRDARAARPRHQTPSATAPAAEELIRVEVLSGPMDGLVHYSVAGELCIGDGVQADLRLPYDPRVGGRHARLHRSRGLLWLEDLGCAGGTWIGAERLRGSIPVSAGVVFTVGGTLVEIVAEQSAWTSRSSRPGPTKR